MAILAEWVPAEAAAESRTITCRRLAMFPVKTRLRSCGRGQVSGFEASPLSPAGVAQARWRLVRSARNRVSVPLRQLAIAAGLLLGAVGVLALLSLVLNLR